MVRKIQPEQINAVRAFNRLFMRQTGVLREGLLDSPHSLTEVRIIYELAHQDDLTASDLCSALDLDAGYVSRTLANLEKQGLIQKTRSPEDARQRLLSLTDEGQKAYASIDSHAGEEVSEMLEQLSTGERGRLVEAMHTIEDILNRGTKSPEPFYLHHHEPGDIGWVIHQHGLLYRQEYGWDEQFEAAVAQTCADFINNYDSKKERCWIAEINGERVGSIFCVKASEEVAKLRFLLVAPEARGMGLGTRLVEECIRFARRAGYQKVSLWTNDLLTAARKIYEKAGFTLVEEKPEDSFGYDLVAQTWELVL